MILESTQTSILEWLFDNQYELRIRHDRTIPIDEHVNWQDLFLVQKALDSLPHFIHPSAKISKSAEIVEPVVVGENCRVLPGAFIEGPSFIGNGSLVGNCALVRAGSFLSDNCLVGNHSYCTSAVLRPNSGVFHFSGLSRSILGRGSRLGSHIVTETTRVDYSEPRDSIKSPFSDGKKLGAIIGDYTCVGSFVSIAAGTKIGSHCLIGPHLHIAEDILDNSYVRSSNRNQVLENTRFTEPFPDLPRTKFELDVTYQDEF